MNKMPDSVGDTASTMHGLIHVARALEARIEGTLSGVQLSMTKLAVLSALVRAREPLSLGDLASAVACVRSNITQVVDRLEEDGLVKRVMDPSDRRVVRAALTPAGAARQKEGEERLNRVQDEFGASVSPADRAAIDRLASVFR